MYICVQDNPEIDLVGLQQGCSYTACYYTQVWLYDVNCYLASKKRTFTITVQHLNSISNNKLQL